MVLLIGNDRSMRGVPLGPLTHRRNTCFQYTAYTDKVHINYSRDRIVAYESETYLLHAKRMWFRIYHGTLLDFE